MGGTSLESPYQGNSSGDISEERIDIWCKGDVVEECREGRACGPSFRIFHGRLDRLQ